MGNQHKLTAYTTFDGRHFEGIVPEHYRMDPREDILHYAYLLQEGMRVLRDHNHRYVAPNNEVTMLTERRWCTVTELESYEYYVPGANEITGPSIQRIYFIGVYDNGEQIIRQSDRFDGWLVKKDSIRVFSSENGSRLKYRGD